MKKHLSTIIWCSALFVLLLSSTVLANINGNLNMFLFISSDFEHTFDSNVMVEITSDEFSTRAMLNKNMFHTHLLQGIPAGTYNVSAYITRTRGQEQERYDHPYFWVEYPETVTIEVGETLQTRLTLQEKLEPLITDGYEMPEAPILPTREPPLPPEDFDGPPTLWHRFWRSFFGGWFTFILVAIALAAGVAYVIKKMKDRY